MKLLFNRRISKIHSVADEFDRMKSERRSVLDL